MWSTDNARQQEYWEAETTHRDVTHPVARMFSTQRWDFIASVLPINTMMTALDLGCGNGFSTSYAPPSIRCVACDGSLNMLSRHPGAHRVLADAMRLPFADNSFDLVFCWELLHHVAEPWKVLQEMKRVSRRWIIAFEPNPINPAQFLFSLVDREHRWVLKFSRQYLFEQARKAQLKPHIFVRGGLIFPNKTPLFLAKWLYRLPYRFPLAGISQMLVLAKESS